MSLNKQQLLDLHRYLRLTRTLEDWIFYVCHNQNPKNPMIIGKGYLSTGQEAVSVGSAFTLKPEDWIGQSHRDFGALLVRGMTVRELILQYMSKAEAPTWGRDANVHFGDTRRHILGFISHMGTLTAVANGVAYASKYRGEKAVTLAYFGDGASSQGIVHEAMNYAAVFKLPVVFICNNNRWAISTPLREQMAIENIADRAAGYGMPGSICEGNDVLDVYKTVNAAVERARKGDGPSLVECKTMRMAGHGTHDMAKYMPEEEVSAWKLKDPLVLFEKELAEKGHGDEAYFAKIAKECQELVVKTAEEIRDLPGPKTEGQLEDVYAP